MKKKCLLIMVPNNGSVHTEFMKSLIGLTQSLQQKALPFLLKTVEFSDIVMSRNYLMSYFLSDERFSHALFIDSDLSFQPGQFYRLLDFDAEFVAAAYPNRRMSGGIFKALWQGQKEASEEQIESELIQKTIAGSMHYLVASSFSQNTPLPLEKKEGFHTVASMAGGFSLIKREVPEKMVQEGAARRLPRSGTLSIYKDAPQFADFFSHLLADDKTVLLGEDQSFCKRWVQDCGGQIWVDGASNIVHHGEFAFHGEYAHSPQNFVS